MQNFHHRGRRVSGAVAVGTPGDQCCVLLTPRRARGWFGITGHWSPALKGTGTWLLALEGDCEMRCQIRGVMLRCSNGRLPLTPYRQAWPLVFWEKITYGTPPRKSCQAAVPTGADREPEWMKPLFSYEKTMQRVEQSQPLPTYKAH